LIFFAPLGVGVNEENQFINNARSVIMNTTAISLENQFIYPSPRGSKLIFFAPLGVGVNEENQ
jgi:putative effector of murein hydrolase LrgA (UPF0299 family)